MINRYSGEVRINPIAVLRNYDFNNDGEIPSIDSTLSEAVIIHQRMSKQLIALQTYLKENPSPNYEFYFADGGYIAMKGFTDKQLLKLKAEGLIELFDFATDKTWVKKHGAKFGLVWENGRAVEM